MVVSVVAVDVAVMLPTVMPAAFRKNVRQELKTLGLVIQRIPVCASSNSNTFSRHDTPEGDDSPLAELRPDGILRAWTPTAVHLRGAANNLALLGAMDRPGVELVRTHTNIGLGLGRGHEAKREDRRTEEE